MAAITRGLLDTSVIIGQSERSLKSQLIPEVSVISVVTIAELRWGVLSARLDEVRSQRLETLTSAQRLEPIPVDDRVAAAWALLQQRLRTAGLRMEINDSWIAATAMAHGLPVITQDRGFPHGIPELVVIEV